MACTQTLAGLARDCQSSMGGIAEAYVCAFDDVASVTETNGEVSGITMVSSAKFKRYYFRKGSSSFASTLNVDPATGVNYVETTINLLFARMESAKRVEMAAMSVNDMRVIIKDANGVYWFFGKDEPVIASGGDGQTGTARGDANRYAINLVDNSPSFPCAINTGTGGVDLSTILDS